ncbi:MAG: alpha-L-arabinofuranosidase [Ferruginibacter sp.]|nr:alpha-L-arabinofuranosidase [Chitinophagaceae bacterium]
MKLFFLMGVMGVMLLSLQISCKKNAGGGGDVTPLPTDTTVVIAPAIDPPVANTIGFFLDDWQPKTFSAPLSAVTTTTIPGTALYTVTVDRSAVLTKIPRSLFGNNANIWMTQMVTEPSLLDHISTIHPHIVRFPGGSISDVYFWNAQPNIPPADAPAQLLNAAGLSSAAGYWYGKNTANWTISLDNYYSMLQQTGNQGMITINYGYARYGKSSNPVATAAHLAADWVRYDNGRTKFWEIGNENFGDWEAGYRIKLSDNQDGQPEFLTGQLYGQHFKVFADSMRKAALEIGKTVYIGAVTSEAAPQPWWTETAKNWNTGLFTAAAHSPDYNIVHNYYTSYNENSTADVILNTPVPVTQTMMEYVKQSIATGGVTLKPIILGEWNIFAVGSKQAVSHINGLHAVMVLGESIKNKFGMTARWDMANGWDSGNDHGMFNIGDEPDAIPKWNPRPAFYHMYFFQKFLGDRMVSSLSSSTDIISYASSYTSGEVGVTLINKSTELKPVEVKVQNFRKGSKFYWFTVTGGGDNGEFSRKVLINGTGPAGAAGGPVDYKTIVPNAASAANGIRVLVPARSAVFIAIEKQ